jgi:hypothetical protein
MGSESPSQNPRPNTIRPNTIKVSETRHFFRLGGYVFKIVHAEFLASGVQRLVMEAPRTARKQKPGQFVILRIYEEGERIPVTIAKLISI